MRRFLILAILTTICSFQLEAREEVVLTIPKSGTHYLKKIIENITNCQTVQPSVVSNFLRQYYMHKSDPTTIVMGHCEPLILNLLPKKEHVLLLIRDPRDLALSAIDFIDNKGLAVWPGLPSIINRKQWNALSKKEKLSIILEDYYDNRRASIVSLFKTAVQLTQQKNCLVVKYESLSPEYNKTEELTSTLQDIGCFFGEEVDSLKAENVIKKCFRNPSCWTYNKGKAFRYLDEDSEIIELLESNLSNYIDYFEYANSTQ